MEANDKPKALIAAEERIQAAYNAAGWPKTVEFLQTPDGWVLELHPDVELTVFYDPTDGAFDWHYRGGIGEGPIFQPEKVFDVLPEFASVLQMCGLIREDY